MRMRTLLTLCTLLAFGSEVRADFVTGNTALPSTKTDIAAKPVGVLATQWFGAVDYNALMNAANDLRTAIVNGQYHGLAAQAGAPSPVNATNFFWFKNDNTLHFKYGSTDNSIPIGSPTSISQMAFNADQVTTLNAGTSTPPFYWANANKHIIEMFMGTFDPTDGGTLGVEIDAISPLDGTTYLGGLRFSDLNTTLWGPETGPVTQKTFITLADALNHPTANDLLWAGYNEPGGTNSLWGRWWATPHAIEFDAYDPSGAVHDPYVVSTHGGIYFGGDPGGDETDMWAETVGGFQAGLGLRSNGTAYLFLGSSTTPATLNFSTNGSVQPAPVAFADLGTPGNGTITYCSNCAIANPCNGTGAGAIAKRLNGVWVCN